MGHFYLSSDVSGLPQVGLDIWRTCKPIGFTLDSVWLDKLHSGAENGTVHSEWRADTVLRTSSSRNWRKHTKLDSYIVYFLYFPIVFVHSHLLYLVPIAKYVNLYLACWVVCNWRWFFSQVTFGSEWKIHFWYLVDRGQRWLINILKCTWQFPQRLSCSNCQ